MKKDPFGLLERDFFGYDEYYMQQFDNFTESDLQQFDKMICEETDREKKRCQSRCIILFLNPTADILVDLIDRLPGKLSIKHIDPMLRMAIKEGIKRYNKIDGVYTLSKCIRDCGE